MLQRHCRGLAPWLLVVLAWLPEARGVDTSDTSFLHEPAIGSGRIVFVSADDLWTDRVTAPDLASDTDDGWRVENEGVCPDLEVEQWPADVMAGKDPQLDRAIESVLGSLKKNPPKTLEPPKPPIRVRTGVNAASR